MRKLLICPSADLIDGNKGVRFEVECGGVKTPAFAIRFRGRVHAYLNRCGHVPTELDWNPGEFFDCSGLYLICATHGALYAPENGECVGGRCNGKGLVALSVAEFGGEVYLLSEGEG
jgi:nitrite reductase/ring-hydroxylating ferredoxin subunit